VCAQWVGAALALSLLAGVSKPKVFRGVDLNAVLTCRALLSRWNHSHSGPHFGGFGVVLEFEEKICVLSKQAVGSTAFLASQLKRFYVAAPRDKDKAAGVKIYEVLSLNGLCCNTNTIHSNAVFTASVAVTGVHGNVEIVFFARSLTRAAICCTAMSCRSPYAGQNKLTSRRATPQRGRLVLR